MNDTIKDWQKEKIWICPTCGRTADDYLSFNDVACAMRALQCYRHKVHMKEGLATFVEDGGVVNPQPNTQTNRNQK